MDLDARLVGSHSEEEEAAPTYKKGFGFHPLWSFVDHKAEGTLISLRRTMPVVALASEGWLVSVAAARVRYPMGLEVKPT